MEVKVKTAKAAKAVVRAEKEKMVKMDLDVAVKVAPVGWVAKKEEGEEE